MDTTNERSITMEISEVPVTEIVNSDFCKIYEVDGTPFNVRHFLEDDKKTKEVVICIGDEAIAKYSCIDAAMWAIKTKDWKLILVGAWVYGKKMDQLKLKENGNN